MEIPGLYAPESKLVVSRFFSSRSTEEAKSQQLGVWRTWTGTECARFIADVCQLPEYGDVVERNLTGAYIDELLQAGLLSKGLAKIGIGDFEHVRQITAAIQKLDFGAKLGVSLGASTQGKSMWMSSKEPRKKPIKEAPLRSTSSLLSPSLAQQAVHELNNSELHGRALQVKLMEAKPPGERQAREPDPRHVLISGISAEVDGDTLRALCEGRVGKVTYLNVFKDKQSGEHKGAAKVEFETPHLAERAMQLLSGFELCGRALAVRRFGEDRPAQPQADGRTIFLGGLGWDVGSDDLQVFASQVGTVTYASVFIDKETGKSKGCGKVQYETPEIAAQAVEELAGRELLGREVTVRLMEARPKPRPEAPP